MQVSLIYALALISAIGALWSWRIFYILLSQARKRIASVIVKWTFYTLIWPRLNGSSDFSIATISCILLLFTTNGVSSILGVHGRLELSVRLAKLCIGNLIFVVFGGRASVVLDRALRLPMTEYSLMHKWIGRISLIEGMVHAILQILEHAKLQAIELSVRQTRKTTRH